MSGLDFIKMHGLGNDFVIVDAREHVHELSREAIRRIGDRHTGIGFDQLLRIEPSDKADAFMRIWNPDGSDAEACGNGTRCVAHLLMDEDGRDSAEIETVAGVLPCRLSEAGISVDMGPANLAWRDIPLASDMDTLAIDLGDPAPGQAVAVNMGNPHMVFFVDDAEAIDVPAVGAALERHSVFPEGANVSFAQVTGDNQLRLRVWERGAGQTQACGSAACATGVAANRRGLAGRQTTINLDGGPLTITWREDDGHVLMAGTVAFSFHGVMAPHLTA
ncbi:MAG: diaminopimelate epimerase [Pseudomonadota bacterium]